MGPRRLSRGRASRARCAASVECLRCDWSGSRANPRPMTESNSSDLLLRLDRRDGRGLRRQLEAQLREAIHDGRLGPGASLPASRVLARELGVARSVVVEAYGQLVADGYLEARQGSGTRVRSGTVAAEAGRVAPAGARPAPRPPPP